MDIPYDGKVNIRLVVKRFKNKTFYYVSTFDNYKYSFKPCTLSSASIQSFPFVRYFDNGKATTWSQGADWNRLFDKYEDAEKESKRLNSLHFDGFRYKPYLKTEELEAHKPELVKVENLINKLLSGFANYKGIDFCNVSANGTQIRLHHKKIVNYVYGEQITISPDYSNIDDVALLVVKEWINRDNPQDINKELAFIAEGEKYDWN